MPHIIDHLIKKYEINKILSNKTKSENVQNIIRKKIEYLKIFPIDKLINILNILPIEHLSPYLCKYKEYLIISCQSNEVIYDFWKNNIYNLYPGHKICRYCDCLKELFDYPNIKLFSLLKICLNGCFIFYMCQYITNIKIIKQISKKTNFLNIDKKIRNIYAQHSRIFESIIYMISKLNLLK